jgi:hypothetical protein
MRHKYQTFLIIFEVGRMTMKGGLILTFDLSLPEDIDFDSSLFLGSIFTGSLLI